jgi:hypothetical protein
MKLSENTNVTLDLKTIGMIIGFTLMLAGTYWSLQGQISLAMNEPQPEVSKIEFQYKDELVRTTIEKVEKDVVNIQEDIDELKEQLAKMEERLYNKLR